MENKTTTYLANLLQSCIDKKSHLAGKLIHAFILRIGLASDSFLSNRLIELYSKCGNIHSAHQVFDQIPHKGVYSWNAILGAHCKAGNLHDAYTLFVKMPERNTVSWNTLISAFARSGFEKKALDAYDSMISEGFLPTRFTLASIFSACGALEDSKCGRRCHGLVIKIGLDVNMYVANALLCMYAKCGLLRDAIRVFEVMPEHNEVTFTAMMGGLVQTDRVVEALEMFRLMCRKGIGIDSVSLSSILGVCARGCSGFEPDEVTYINMLAACIRSGDVETGRQMFDSMPCPSVSSWNAMLSGYAQSGNHNEAIKLFREMQFQSVHSDRTTLAIILSSCAATGLLESGKQVHAASQKAFFHTDIYVASGLVGMYAKCGKTQMATRIFSNMSELDIVCWNSMIAGFSFNSLDMEAFTLFKQMRQNGMCPTQFSYATVLSCCAKVSSSFQGRQVHAQIAKDGYMNDIFVGSALIDMYSKCGDVDGARCFFDMMPGKNSVTWNEMIHGYAQNGHGYEAVCLYNDMISSGEKPDGITFVAVLTACSHSGLVDVGIEIFDSMHQEHGVEPFLDHYTCIIDSLGRAGRFHEAEMLIDKMPYKDDPVIWEVLLSSCRVHANVDLAKRAADELFHLDPQNSAPYVLLANIYSSLGRWDDVKAVRELMSEKQVIKEPGYSWIDYRNDMQTYKVYKDLRMVNVEAQAVSERSSCYNG
ncbi:hypothetical protein ACJW31_05G147800 [Castanea mollissima]